MATSLTPDDLPDHRTDGRAMAAALLEVVSRLHHVGSSMRCVELSTSGQATRRASAHRNARHATLRVATHRYATLEPLGKPGGSRAFSVEGHQCQWHRDAYRSPAGG